MATVTPRQRRQRMMLLLIAAISLIPFLLAWLYVRHPEWTHAPSNYGSLVTPAQPLAYTELLRPGAVPTGALEELKGRWILLHVVQGSECGEPCRNSLIMTRQIRLLLNKDTIRVRRLLLTPGSDGATAKDFEADAELYRGQLSPALLQQLAAALAHPVEDGAVLLIDPLANLMMWYGPGFDPYGVLRDLKHLLRYSQIG